MTGYQECRVLACIGKQTHGCAFVGGITFTLSTEPAKVEFCKGHARERMNELNGDSREVLRFKQDSAS